jgi:hypothetical protein
MLCDKYLTVPSLLLYITAHCVHSEFFFIHTVIYHHLGQIEFPHRFGVPQLLSHPHLLHHFMSICQGMDHFLDLNQFQRVHNQEFKSTVSQD